MDQTATTVRRATPDDAATVDTLVLELAEHEGFRQYVDVDVPIWRELLARPEVVVLLAERDGGPVGYVSAVRQLSLWRGRELLGLDDLYVREAARGQRVGEALMRGIAEYAADDRLVVRWELEQANDGARRFYERLGAWVRDKGVAIWQPDDYQAWLAG
jgi:GNAT superfamily N-acetyltransferase